MHKVMHIFNLEKILKLIHLIFRSRTYFKMKNIQMEFFADDLSHILKASY